MTSSNESRVIVGLDIGTSKVVAIVGEMTPEGDLEIVGIGSHQSRGLKKGVVVNIESTVLSIQRAIEEAELMAGCQIHSVFAGIAGKSRCCHRHGSMGPGARRWKPNRDGDGYIKLSRKKRVASIAEVLLEIKGYILLWIASYRCAAQG